MALFIAPHRFSRGFAYIGLLILIAILGIISAATITGGSAMQRRVQEEELLYVGHQFALAFKSYYEATPAGLPSYPATLQDLVRDPRVPGVRRHLRKIHVDPLTGAEDWGVILAPGGRISGVFSKSNAAPIKRTQFDHDLLALEGKEKYSGWVFGYAPINPIIR